MAHGVYKVLTLGKHLNRTIGGAPVDASDAVESTINETIDITVFDRLRSDSSYRPKNLSEWAALRKVDPVTVTTSVNAQDLTPIPQYKPAGTQ